MLIGSTLVIPSAGRPRTLLILHLRGRWFSWTRAPSPSRMVILQSRWIIGFGKTALPTGTTAAPTSALLTGIRKSTSGGNRKRERFLGIRRRRPRWIGT